MLTLAEAAAAVGVGAATLWKEAVRRGRLAVAARECRHPRRHLVRACDLAAYLARAEEDRRAEVGVPAVAAEELVRLRPRPSREPPGCRPASRISGATLERIVRRRGKAGGVEGLCTAALVNAARRDAAHRAGPALLADARLRLWLQPGR